MSMSTEHFIKVRMNLARQMQWETLSKDDKKACMKRAVECFNDAIDSRLKVIQQSAKK